MKSLRNFAIGACIAVSGCATDQLSTADQLHLAVSGAQVLYTGFCAAKPAASYCSAKTQAEFADAMQAANDAIDTYDTAEAACTPDASGTTPATCTSPANVQALLAQAVKLEGDVLAIIADAKTKGASSG